MPWRLPGHFFWMAGAKYLWMMTHGLFLLGIAAKSGLGAKRAGQRLGAALLLGVALAGLAGLGGCGEATPDFTPKPKGYNRIDLPAHRYRELPGGHPYTFEYSREAVVRRDSSYLAKPHWLNVYYPQLHANVQITYMDVARDRRLYDKMMEDARKLTGKHQIKATAIDERMLLTPNGMRVSVFELQGEVPSQFQFYTTDSTRHFLRGALYFRTATANDSLAPVIEYVKADMVRMMNTLRYR